MIIGPSSRRTVGRHCIYWVTSGYEFENSSMLVTVFGVATKYLLTMFCDCVHKYKGTCGYCTVTIPEFVLQ